MEEDHEGTSSSIYFASIIEPGQEEHVETNETDNLIISNVCLGELPDNFSTKPVRLIASIMNVDKTNLLDPVVKRNKVLLASLIPGSVEHAHINITFSPLDDITLLVDGEYPIHVAGYCVPVDLDSDCEYCEEEEDC